MKSPMFLLRHVLEDIEDECGISTTRDLQTISGRVEHEGISFLTISLADFGKDFQKSLDQGSVGSDAFQGFSRKRGLPKLLRGFLCHVFDEVSGRLLDDPCVRCIRAIRQITLMFAKIELECTDARKRSAIDKYLECEKEVRIADSKLSEEILQRFSDVSARLWGPALSKVENFLYRGEPVPFNHGNGQTANRKMGNSKYDTWVWTERLEQVFPFGDSCLPNARYSSEYLPVVDFLEPGREMPVRVSLVPKTLKTPRVIAMEPSWMMFVQKGLEALIRDSIEEVPHLDALIGWRSQIPNQDLARLSSGDGSLATLDLSEASDRVSNQHVLALLRSFPLLSEAVQAARSRKAEVPDHPKIIRLAKFASMGSALTFPIEAMVFMTIIVLSMEVELNRRLSTRDIKSLVGSVRVYGDDIIIPVDFADSTVRLLEDFGLQVNRNKSFWNGKFRESCGKEFYASEDVSIFKMRSLFPTRRADVHEVESLYSLRNQAYWFGYWRTARALDEEISRLGFPNPTVLRTSPVMGRNSVLGYEISKSCDRLHRPMVKGFVGHSPLPRNRIEGIPALFKCLNKASDLPFEDPEHLERSGRPAVRALKLRWGPPF